MNEYEKALNKTEDEEKEIISDVDKEAVVVYSILKGINYFLDILIKVW